MTNLRFQDYLKAAFSAKPKGMFLPPNWFGLAAFGLLGFLNPGWWLIGAGLEVAYLLACASSKPFRKVITAQAKAVAAAQDTTQVQGLLRGLDPKRQHRHALLLQSCHGLLGGESGSDQEAKSKSLAHLAWVHLNMLVTQSAIARSLEVMDAEEQAMGSLAEKMEEVESLLAQADTPELRTSLEGRLRILTERQARHEEAQKKETFTEAELDRIEEQVRLLRDDAVLQNDPAGFSRSLDRVTAELSEAAHWVREQRSVYQELGSTLEVNAPQTLHQIE